MKPIYSKYLTLSAFFLTYLFISCGSNETIGGSAGNVDEVNPEVTSIVLSSNSNTVNLNDTITLNLVTNTGEQVTSSAEFYLDGVSISSNSYNFSSEGTYVFTAIYDGLTSNELTFTITENNLSLIHI